MAKDNLTGQMENFVLAFMRIGVASDAYREAYDCSRMKNTTVNRMAHALLHLPKVAARIAQLRQAAEKEVVFGIAEVMREWVDLATADPNKLMKLRRVNCRRCNGVNHEYQWKDRLEFAKAQAERMDANAARKRQKLNPLPPVEDAGGYGFHPAAEPHPGCPECRGEGHLDEFVFDTDKLTGKERKLFAGFKRTKDGLQVLTRDQDAALANLAKAMGMFVERTQVLEPGAKANIPAVPLNQNDASQVYRKWVADS